MESEAGPRGTQVRCAGDLVEVIDPSSRRCGTVGRIAYFVGDNVYVSFGRHPWSPKHMFFLDQLSAVAAAQPRAAAHRTQRFSRLLNGAARLLTLLHLP